MFQLALVQQLHFLKLLSEARVFLRPIQRSYACGTSQTEAHLKQSDWSSLNHEELFSSVHSPSTLQHNMSLNWNFSSATASANPLRTIYNRSIPPWSSPLIGKKSRRKPLIDLHRAIARFPIHFGYILSFASFSPSFSPSLGLSKRSNKKNTQYLVFFFFCWFCSVEQSAFVILHNSWCFIYMLDNVRK